MRLTLALPLLLAACSVENDAGNDHISLDYDQNRIENAARTAAGTAKEIGSGLGNVAASTGRAIENEVGDIDVDVNVSRRRGEDAGNAAANQAQAH
ncbi:MAG TPA: hypothetical protein VF727_10255 [Allosphingosinicella sp.]|jgi:hypothetical protein